MSTSIETAIATLMSLGGEAAQDRYEEFSASLVTILEARPEDIADRGVHEAAIRHGFSYFYWKWDKRGASLVDTVTSAIAYWASEPQPPLNLMCELVDFAYFLVWCFDESSEMQCRRLITPLRLASKGLARDAPFRAFWNPVGKKSLRIAWLGMYAQTHSPMSIALRAVAPALRAKGHHLDVYAWRFIDDVFAIDLQHEGARILEFPHETSLDKIRAIEAQALRERPDVVISDMNNGLPTVLFSRRLAPVQIFLQAGMPVWPVENLDGVFNSFGFDPRLAGWGDAVMLRIDAPWDRKALNPDVMPGDIAAERSRLPQAKRLVGSYGRFSKVTLPYLEAVERILLRCPDVSFILGGTGDARHIRDFISRSPAADRIAVEERYVDGHVWGHILDLLLDTWPVTGGVAAREMLAKSRPVVTRYSAEMPAIHLQRDPALVAQSWDEFTDTAVRLLQDPDAYAQASLRASDLVRRLSEATTFEQQLDDDIRRSVRHAHFRQSRVGRMWTGLKGRRLPGTA